MKKKCSQKPTWKLDGTLPFEMRLHSYEQRENLIVARFDTQFDGDKKTYSSNVRFEFSPSDSECRVVFPFKSPARFKKLDGVERAFQHGLRTMVEMGSKLIEAALREEGAK